MPKQAEIIRLFAGGRYLRDDGITIRTIAAVIGDMVQWFDHVGPGRCRKATFRKRIISYADDCPAPPLRAKMLPSRRRDALRNATERAERQWRHALYLAERIEDNLAGTYVQCAYHLPERKKDLLGMLQTEVSGLVQFIQKRLRSIEAGSQDVGPDEVVLA